MSLRRSNLPRLTRSRNDWRCRSKSVPDLDWPPRVLQNEALRWIKQRVLRTQMAIMVLLVALAAELAAFAITSDWNALVFSAPVAGIAAVWTIKLEGQLRQLKPCRVRNIRCGRPSSPSHRQ